MITLHLLQHLQNAGYGTLNESLFFEKLPLAGEGVAIYSVGGERGIGGRSKSQLFELEVKGESDLLGYDKLDKIAKYLANEWVICDLPTIPGVSNRLYRHCRVLDVGNIQNVGYDANDRVLCKITARIVYQN